MAIVQTTVKFIEPSLWRIMCVASNNGDLYDIVDRIEWCENNFGPTNTEPPRWRYIEDGTNVHRFWICNREDFVAFNLTWL